MKTKTIIAVFLFLAISIVKAYGNTIAIGCFELPFSFESTTPGEPVFSVVTNDVVRYFASVTHFADRCRPGLDSVPLSPRWPAGNLAKNPLFEDNVSFREEYGVTNVVIGTNFVQKVCDILPDLDFRTNLLCQAEGFVATFSTGSATNCSPAEMRRFFRRVSGKSVEPLSTETGTDDDVRNEINGIVQDFRFEPPCLLELTSRDLAGRTIWLQPIRMDVPNGPASSDYLEALVLVYADGYWSFLF